MTPQQRRLAWILGGGLAILLVYLAVVSPIISLEDSWSQELVRKRQLLAKYQALLDNKAKVDQAHAAMKTAIAQMEGQFLTGGNPAVAAADLQEILKNLTSSHGVILTSTKILTPRDAGSYQEVPVQVQISGTVAQLVTILYNLEHHKKFLFITDLEVNAPRWMAGTQKEAMLQVNLIVSGVIKKVVEKKGTTS